MIELIPQPLTSDGFAQFGEVIELEQAEKISINRGLTTRFHDLARLDVLDQDGHATLNVFRTTPIDLPFRVETMERHPLGSQAFLPMHHHPFLVLVAPEPAPIRATELILFVSNGSQGINIFKNTWHHFQLALGTGESTGPQDFVVIDRGGPGFNLEEVAIDGEAIIAPPEKWRSD